MAKHLIVYYTQSGNCEKIVKTLAKKTDADVEQIRPVKPYRGKFPLRGIWDCLRKKCPDIKTEKLDCAGYEHVILVFPIWADGFPPHIRTYLMKNGSKIGSLYTVCASGSSGDEGVLKQIQGECELRPRGGIVVHNAELADKTFIKKLESFAAKL